MSLDSSEPDDLRRQVTNSVGWVFVERWGSRLLQLLVIALLTRLVAPEAFGVVSLATAIVAVVQVLVDSGFAKALIQLKELEEDDATTAFWASVFISIIVFGALAGLAPIISELMDAPGLAPVLIALGSSLPISALSQVPAALLEREFNFRVLSMRQLVAAVAGALVAIPVALLGGGVWALVAQTLSTAAVACIVLWASTRWRPAFRFSLRSLRRLFPVGMSIMGTELLDALQGNIDKIAIGIFFSPEILGYYYLAQRVIMILAELVTTVISRVSLTTFSRVQDDLPRLNRIFRQLTFAAGLIGVPVFAFIAVFGIQIIPLVFGEEWTESVPIMWGLAGSSALTAIMYFDRTVLLARGRAQSAFWLAALQNVVGILLLFALIPFGIAGVVVSRWARVFVWPVRLLVLKSAVHLAVGRYLLQILRAIVAVLPGVVIVVILQSTPWATSAGSAWSFALPVGILFMASYGALAWLLAGEENRAVLRPIVWSVFGRFRRKG